MIRPVRIAVLLALPLVLAACGSEVAGGSGDSGSSGGSAEQAADRGELEARAQAIQVAIENVYVTEVPDFTVAEQSVGVIGDDGFSATYVRRDPAAQIQLSVDRGTVDATTCPGFGGRAAAGQATCEKDGKGWYSSGSGRHAYLIPVTGRLLRLSADRAAVERDALRRAAEQAHPASDAELTDVLPPLPENAPTAPVERGDLPPEGDGAPDNGVGVGG
ncbi:hypothetical protein [Streptomyces sp. NBC_01304]|uniref:hypothetical protein n=1 Tax=Streptomyces sp. NBC_01304 TaxID=2903818 RepID=UPI002E10AE55|nr:hypothetical protein OG430_40680 [Streptomyces sp. NBC_01304]